MHVQIDARNAGRAAPGLPLFPAHASPGLCVLERV